MIKNKSQGKQWKPKQERVMDLSKQDNFLFNKTPILASALQRLKKHEGGEKKKNNAVTPQKQGKNFEPEDL